MNEIIATMLLAWTYLDLALVCAWIIWSAYDFFFRKRR